MAWVPLAAAAIGTISSAAGSLSSSKAEANAAKYNAQIAEQNATIAEQQSKAAVEQQQRDTYRQAGAIRAAYGASGVTGDGTPMDVLADSYTMAILDRETIKYQYALEAQSYRNEANLQRTNAKNAKKAGYISAASKLLDGGAQTYGYYRTSRAGKIDTPDTGNTKELSSKSTKTTTTTTSTSSKK